MHGLLITGTDTGVGKTFAACGIVRALREQGLRVGAYKPACSGGETRADGTLSWPDVDLLASALAADARSKQICPQRFAAPLAPPAAAALEQRRVDERLLTAGVEAWRGAADLLIIEGVGGLLCPLSEHLTVADFAERIGVPLVIVAALRLGVINHTLLTLEVARARGLPVAGVLLNQVGPDDGSNASSIAEITVRGGAKVLGVLPFDHTREPHSTSVAAPSPRRSPPQCPGEGGGVNGGGEGEASAAGLSSGDPAARLRPRGILSRIDWLGLSAEIPHL
jgi:dethiobiotin synthetase